MYPARTTTTHLRACGSLPRRPIRRRILIVLWALVGGPALSAGPVAAQQTQPEEAKDQPPKTERVQQGQTPQFEVIPRSDTVTVHPMDPPDLSKLKPGPVAATETPEGPVTGGPGIRCSETIKDFGTHWAGDSLRHAFIIHNQGDQVLKILKVKASCGCTATPNYDREIPPGGSGEIPVVLNTKKVRSKFTKYVTVTSNDPVTPRLRLQITGEIKYYVDVKPRRLAMGHIGEDEEVGKTAQLTNNTSEPMTVDLETDRIGPFTAELIETEAGKQYTLQVTAKPPYETKLNTGKFILKTNLAQQPTIEIPVTAYLPPRLDLRPAALVLPTKLRKEQSRLIRFTNSGATPVKILSAEVGDDRLEVEIVERNPGKSYDVKLLIPAGFQPPPKGKEIFLTLATDDAESPELRVPISARAARQRPAARLVGKTAPAAEFTTTGGQVVTTGTTTDKVTVLDFFASWCGFSKKQVPALAQLHRQKFADNPNVQFVGISQDLLKKEGLTSKRARTPEQIDQMWAKTGAEFDYALDPQNLGRRGFKVSSYPTVVLLGKEGMVQAVHFGSRGNLAATLEEQINLLLAGKSLSQAGRPGAAKAAVDAGTTDSASRGPRPTMVGRRTEAASGLVDKVKAKVPPTDEASPGGDEAKPEPGGE